MLNLTNGNRCYKGPEGLHHLHMDKIQSQFLQFSRNDTRLGAMERNNPVADLRKRPGDSGLHFKPSIDVLARGNPPLQSAQNKRSCVTELSLLRSRRLGSSRNA